MKLKKYTKFVIHKQTETKTSVAGVLS